MRNIKPPNYDFVGKVLESKTVHDLSTASKTVARSFIYDHAGRLLRTYHKINDQPEVLLSELSYNELGQLVDKKLHSTDNGTTFKQSVDHRYNIRGWLTRINNSDLTPDNANDPRDHFGMNLAYNDVIGGINNTPQFNGNISATTWSANQGFDNTKESAYKFEYDPMNRLTGATHQEKVTHWAASTSFHEDNITYNLNGGIQALSRKGANGLQMDNLVFDYGTGEGRSNQVMKVSDSWDKTKGFVDGGNTDNDYSYDANGSRNSDKNKGITSITYNHLNQPDKITFQTGNYLRYTYDASGRKLSQGVYNSANALQKKTDYAGEFFYENDTLKYIRHEEGRYNALAGAYEYELRDHLGNNRVTFTTNEEQDAATATMEIGNATAERSKFVRYDNARKVYATLFDKTNGASPGYAIRLNGSANEKIGIARTFAVVPGDVVKTEVYVKYVDANSSNWTAALNTLITQIAGGTAPAGTVIDGAGYSTSTSSFPYAGLLNTSGSSGPGPKAYLNWLIFDKDFVFRNGGYVRMSDAAKEYGQDVAHEKLSAEFTINEPGFVYIYFSNDNETVVDVYADDFNVTLQKSPVVNSTEYFPYGLTSASYSREHSLKQNQLYNNKELQDELNLGAYDYGARFYDPAAPVWWQVDPLAEQYIKWSPYTYAVDNPIRFIDPDGMKVVESADRTTYTEDDARNKFMQLQAQSNSRRSQSNASNFGASGFSFNQRTREQTQECPTCPTHPPAASTAPSATDLFLAGIGTAGLVAESQSAIIAGSRSGLSSGKLSSNSPRVYSKPTAVKVNIAAKGVGWGLTFWSLYNTEAQFRNGEIDSGRRRYNHLNNGVGVVFPAAGLPMAAGDYLGQKYSNEIVNDISQPGGYTFGTMKWILETIGIPTSPGNK